MRRKARLRTQLQRAQSEDIRELKARLTQLAHGDEAAHWRLLREEHEVQYAKQRQRSVQKVICEREQIGIARDIIMHERRLGGEELRKSREENAEVIQREIETHAEQRRELVLKAQALERERLRSVVEHRAQETAMKRQEQLQLQEELERGLRQVEEEQWRERERTKARREEAEGRKFQELLLGAQQFVELQAAERRLKEQLMTQRLPAHEQQRRHTRERAALEVAARLTARRQELLSLDWPNGEAGPSVASVPGTSPAGADAANRPVRPPVEVGGIADGGAEVRAPLSTGMEAKVQKQNRHPTAAARHLPRSREDPGPQLKREMRRCSSADARLC